MPQTLSHPGYTMPLTTGQSRQALPEGLKLLLVPLVALFVVVPRQMHGSSCGDDYLFHVTGWLDAAHQMRAGVLYPRWTDLGAYNAGEPRFTFYPPISWMLGALLVLVLPSAPVSIVFVFVALTAAGFAMYALARQYATQSVALFCAALYTVNPYMVCNAFERSAFAELLCATWMPLLFLGMLRSRPTPMGLALPLSLLWLTNVPSAILAVYCFLLFFSLRVAVTLWQSRSEPEGPFLGQRTGPLLQTAVAGLLLAIALSAVYVIPVIRERGFVLGASSFTTYYVPAKNFLFGNYPVHKLFIRGARWLALGALSTAAIALFLILKPFGPHSAGPSYGIKGNFGKRSGAMLPMRTSACLMAGMVMVIGFSLTSLSGPFWQLPGLHFVQFPWRQLTPLFVLVCLSAALALQDRLGDRQGRRLLIAAPVLALPLALLFLHTYRRGSVAPHADSYLDFLAAHGHGFAPTPEYTVSGAADAPLGLNDPGYWLAAAPDGPAPGAQVSQVPGNMDANFVKGWGPATTLSDAAPRHLVLDLRQPQVLVLHLRAYPNWHLFRNGVAQPMTLHRADGLIAMSLPAGHSAVDVQWQRPADQKLGEALSLVAAVGLVAGSYVDRKTQKRSPLLRN